MKDLSGSTIQRQRRELQLLMAELKDREGELNAMVASHRKQIQAWEQDRRRILTMEQRCRHLDGEDTDTNHEDLQMCTALYETAFLCRGAPETQRGDQSSDETGVGGRIQGDGSPKGAQCSPRATWGASRTAAVYQPKM